jgi:hypothetical protein
VDRGPGGAHAKREKTAKRHTHRDHAVSGRVRLSLFGPKGELRGALLAKRRRKNLPSCCAPGQRLRFGVKRSSRPTARPSTPRPWGQR